jgi:hypothetical protein
VTNICIIATGDRYGVFAEWRQVVTDAFRDPGRRGRTGVLLHGDSTPVRKGAMGCDKIAAKIAGMHGWAVVPVPAMWDDQGKAAGPIRNRRMLKIGLALQEQGYELRVYAFHDYLANSKGTLNMVELAEGEGVPVTVFTSRSRE